VFEVGIGDAVAYLRMNGLGRSGSSGAHLAGVAASRYTKVGTGIIVGSIMAVLLPDTSLPIEVALLCDSIDSDDDTEVREGFVEFCDW